MSRRPAATALVGAAFAFAPAALLSRNLAPEDETPLS